jgi:hypothetical protein
LVAMMVDGWTDGRDDGWLLGWSVGSLLGEPVGLVRDVSGCLDGKESEKPSTAMKNTPCTATEITSPRKFKCLKGPSQHNTNWGTQKFGLSNRESE